MLKIKEHVDTNDPKAIMIPFSGAFELKIMEMEDDERNKYMEEVKAKRLVSIKLIWKVKISF